MPEKKEKSNKTPVIFSYTTTNEVDAGQGFSQELINCYAENRSQGLGEFANYKIPWTIRGTPGFQRLPNIPGTNTKNPLTLLGDILAFKYIRFFDRPDDFFLVITKELITLFNHTTNEVVQDWIVDGTKAFDPDIDNHPISIASNGFTIVLMQYDTLNAWILSPFYVLPESGRNDVDRFGAIEAGTIHPLSGDRCLPIEGGEQRWGRVSFAYGRYFITQYRRAHFRWSGVFSARDGTVFPRDYTATTESNPDEVYRIEYNGKFLAAIGAQSVELWSPNTQATGGNNAFAKLPGTDILRGCISPEAATTVGQTIMWLSRDGSVWSITDPRERRLTESAQAQILKTPLPAFTGADPEGCSLLRANIFSWEEEGHDFMAIQTTVLTSENNQEKTATMVYDVTTGFWHKRSTPTENRKYGPWDVTEIENVRGQLFALKGTFENHDIVTMSRCHNKDNHRRETIKRRAVSNPIEYQRKQITMHAFEVDMRQADEVPADQPQPSVQFSWSINRGQTFTEPEDLPLRPIPPDTQSRIRWDFSKGRPYETTARSIIIKLEYEEPDPFVVFGAFIEDNSLSR